MRIRIHRPVNKSSTPINTTLVAKQQKKQPVNHPKLDAPDPKFNFDLSKIPISSPDRPSSPPSTISLEFDNRLLQSSTVAKKRDVLVCPAQVNYRGQQELKENKTKLTTANRQYNISIREYSQKSSIQTKVRNKVVKKIQTYDEIIDRVASEQGIDPNLVRGIIAAESQGKADLKAASGYKGLMQAGKEKEHYDPEYSIRIGIRKYKNFFKQVSDFLKNHEIDPGSINDESAIQWCMVAYNAGPGTVLTAMKYAIESGNIKHWLEPKNFQRSLIYYGSYSVSTALRSGLRKFKDEDLANELRSLTDENEHDLRNRYFKKGKWNRKELSKAIKKHVASERIKLKKQKNLTLEDARARASRWLIRSVEFKHNNIRQWYVHRVIEYMRHFEQLETSENSLEPVSNEIPAWLEHAIEQNNILGSKIGWISQVDEIIVYFQNLNILPSSETPNAEKFAIAVQDYQRQNKLKDDGIIGSNTWRQLKPNISANITDNEIEAEKKQKKEKSTDGSLIIERLADDYNNIRIWDKDKSITKGDPPATVIKTPYVLNNKHAKQGQQQELNNHAELKTRNGKTLKQDRENKMAFVGKGTPEAVQRIAQAVVDAGLKQPSEMQDYINDGPYRQKDKTKQNGKWGVDCSGFAGIAISELEGQGREEFKQRSSRFYRLTDYKTGKRKKTREGDYSPVSPEQSQAGDLLNAYESSKKEIGHVRVVYNRQEVEFPEIAEEKEDTKTGVMLSVAESTGSKDSDTNQYIRTDLRFFYTPDALTVGGKQQTQAPLYRLAKKDNENPPAWQPNLSKVHYSGSDHWVSGYTLFDSKDSKGSNIRVHLPNGGFRMTSDRIPNGASGVELKEVQSSKVHVRWKNQEGWVPISRVAQLETGCSIPKQQGTSFSNYPYSITRNPNIT